MMSGWTPPCLAISSRAISAVVEMPWTLSLNSSRLDAHRMRFLQRDESLLVEAEDRLVERLHPVLRRARRRLRHGIWASDPCR